MKRVVKLSAGLLVAAIGLPAAAALPPYYQRTAEIRDILDNGDVQKKLNNQPITAVTYVGNDSYEVRSDQCRVPVRTITRPRLNSGPRRFSLSVGAARCAPVR